MKQRLLPVLALGLLILAFFINKSDRYKKTEPVPEPAVAEALPVVQPLPASPKKKINIRNIKKKELAQKPVEMPAVVREERATSEEKPVSATPAARAIKESSEARWEVQNLPKAMGDCATQDCTPRGREGVLMVGTSLLADRANTSWAGTLEMGRYEMRTPLLHIH